MFTLCNLNAWRTPGFPVPHHLPKFVQVHVHCIGDAIQPSHPLMHLFLQPSIFPSIRNLSNESAVRIRWPKYWSFSFIIQPSDEFSGLISLKIDWFHLLAVQETVRSLLQNHSLKASILQCSAFFMVQLSQMYMTTGKTIALDIWTLVSRVMTLIFNKQILSYLSCQEAIVFWFYDCSYHSQWFFNIIKQCVGVI